MEKVTLIVPVYNVKPYLKKCVDSIMAQTYKELDILLIDDGSTDGSSEICDELKERDERIQVFHRQNGGLSSARNVGLDKVMSYYVMFVDSDDCIEPELVERCVKRIEADGSDMVIFGYNKVNEDGKVLQACTFGDKVLTQAEAVSNLYKSITEMSFGYAWNKLYRFDPILRNEMKFDSSIIDREDLVFNMQMLDVIEKISYLDYAGYAYLQRSGSLLHNHNLARLMRINSFCIKMYGIHVADQDMHRKVYNMNVLHYLSDCIIKNIMWNEELNSKEKRKFIEEVIEDFPYKDKLYDDPDNGRHLKMLYKTIVTGKVKYFYSYVKASDMKKKVTKK